MIYPESYPSVNSGDELILEGLNLNSLPSGLGIIFGNTKSAAYSHIDSTSWYNFMPISERNDNQLVVKFDAAHDYGARKVFLVVSPIEPHRSVVYTITE